MGVGDGSVDVPIYLQPLVRTYQISRLGGEGIDWETGNWGSMPSLVVECFLELQSGINKGLEFIRKRRDSKADMNKGGGSIASRRRKS